jgi:hypothetical protein
MSRRQRQLDEIHDLCRRGCVARAIDLAFGHFAEFGRDDGIVAGIEDAIERTGAPADVQRRIADWCARPS